MSDRSSRGNGARAPVIECHEGARYIREIGVAVANLRWQERPAGVRGQAV
jgi:hypothetical protein